MARVDPDELAHHELTLVFLTVSLAEARRAEQVLSARGVDYVVTVEACGTTFFGSPRHGAGFHVTTAQAEYCRLALLAAGFEVGVCVEEPPR
jgi:hypothetical protein